VLRVLQTPVAKLGLAKQLEVGRCGTSSFLGTVLALTGAEGTGSTVPISSDPEFGAVIEHSPRLVPIPWQDQSKINKTKRLAIAGCVREVFALDEKYLTFQTKRFKELKLSAATAPQSS